jgi:hypothetical protein
VLFPRLWLIVRCAVYSGRNPGWVLLCTINFVVCCATARSSIDLGGEECGLSKSYRRPGGLSLENSCVQLDMYGSGEMRRCSAATSDPVKFWVGECVVTSTAEQVCVAGDLISAERDAKLRIGGCSAVHADPAFHGDVIDHGIDVPDSLRSSPR